MRTKLFYVCTVLLCSVMFLSSCASILTETVYPVAIKSNPNNATVLITDSRGRGVFHGQTPVVARLPASNGFFSQAGYKITFSAPGYQSKTTYIQATIDGWYFGNILLGGIIGMLIIDPATGAMWKIQEEVIHETLTPASAELRIINIKDLSEDLIAKLERIN